MNNLIKVEKKMMTVENIKNILSIFEEKYLNKKFDAGQIMSEFIEYFELTNISYCVSYNKFIITYDNRNQMCDHEPVSNICHFHFGVDRKTNKLYDVFTCNHCESRLIPHTRMLRI